MKKFASILSGVVALALVILLFSCASTPKAVSQEIMDEYPILPVEEIMQSSRTVQELMSDTRQYFKKSYSDISADVVQTDPTLISMRFYPMWELKSMGQQVGWATCDFHVIVEFKDDGRMRFTTENISVCQVISKGRGKQQIGGHDWMYPQLGVDTDAIRITAGEKYNQVVKEMSATLHRIAAGKTEYTW